MTTGKMLGRIWAGGHYCNGTPEYKKRRKRAEARDLAREIADEMQGPGFPVCSPWPADQRSDGGGIEPAY